MENLPDEILLMIFQYLPSRDILGCVRNVCQRWAALAEHSAMCLESMREMDRMNLRTRSVRILTYIVPFRLFLTITPKIAPYLRELTIYAASPLAPGNYALLNNLVHLEHLDIFLRDRVLDLRLLPVLLKMKSLVINEIVSEKVLRALAGSENLRSLYMYGRSLYYPRRELAILLRARRHHLRELVLRCNELQDTVYSAIGQCHELTSLQLYSCWLMREAGILATTCPRGLRRLHITGTRMVRSSSLAIFLEHIPESVEELVLSMSCFGDEHIAPLIHRLPALRVLELWKCRLTAEGAVMLAEALTSLRILDLDITLTNNQIRNLDKHPSLLYVRCLTETKNSNLSRAESIKKIAQMTKNIKVMAADERYPLKYFRGNGEGFRGSLYYYWTQDDLVINTNVSAGNSNDEEYFEYY